MSWFTDWITYFSYSLMWRIVRILPEKTAYALFSWGSRRSYKRNGRRVQRLRSNYRKVKPNISEPELEEMVKAGLESAMRYWCDTFRISDWSKQHVFETVTTTNEHLLVTGASSGDGVIVALPHAGNWDHGGLYFCAKGIPVYTVAEHLKPERLFKKFLEHRNRMGMTVLDLDGGVMPQLRNFLNQGRLVALVADRDLSKSGIEVDFFGSKAKMPPGPALLALDTKASLITVYVSFRENGIHMTFSGPIPVNRSAPDKSIEVERITQSLAGAFERDISEDPTSWHMQQRVFIDPKVSK